MNNENKIDRDFLPRMKGVSIFYDENIDSQ